MRSGITKKLLVTFLVILAVAATALILYYLFFSNGGISLPGTFPTTTPISIPHPPEGGNTNATSSPSLPSVFKPVLRQITNVPVAGAIVFDKNGSTLVRYMERAKSNVYETPADSIKTNRLTNTTIPQIYEAVWKKPGDSVIAIFLKDSDQIQTFDASINPTAKGEGELRGEFLTSNIKNLSVSPSGNQIFYLTESGNGATGIVAAFNGGKKVQIFDSPLRLWLSNWPNENTVALTTKASATSNGVMLLVNTTSGKTKTVISNIAGLTTLVNSDLSKTLFSQPIDAGLSTKIYLNNSQSQKYFPLNTLPEKCVWSKLKKDLIYCAVPESVPSAVYPDDWYQGSISFRDEIWSVDTASGNSQFIMNLGDQSRVNFDAINLSLNEKENYLLLTNKNDLTLWEIQMSL